jgi:hypothetical protein
MYTGKKIFDRAVAIIDELSDTGAVSDSQVKEYKYRAPYLLDMWQKEMAKSGDLFKTFELSRTRKKNLLGDLNQYGAIVENNGESNVYQAVGANCFYFEADGDCVVTFSENGLPVSGSYTFNGGAETPFVGTINITAGTKSFLSCKGILTTFGGNVTMTISGTYYFRHNNRALGPYKLNSALKVPDFKPWEKIDMPADFKSRTQIINEFPMWQYEESNNHRWEGNKELYVLFSYEGLIRIKYIPVPTEITSLDQVLEIDDITAQSGAYYLAEHFFRADQNDTAADRARTKFNELKKESMLKTPLSTTEIIDVYG